MGKKSRAKRDKIHFDLKAPCPTCPFRKDVPYDYEYGTFMKNVFNMVERMMGHTCHYTDTNADLPSNAVTSKQSHKKQHCFGALMMLKREGISPMCMTMDDIRKVAPHIESCTVDVYTLPQLILTHWEDMKVHDPEMFEWLGIQRYLEQFGGTN
jgi:hypothetical protein